MIVVLIIITLISLVYLISKYNFNYWRKRGVPGPKPTFVVGNMGESFLMRRNMGEIITEHYDKYRDLPFVGIFRSSTPALIIRDPDLIREVTVKSFNNFHKNDIDIDKDVDRLFGRNPFCLYGDEWKKVRSQLTPCFTSGKMKSVYPLIQDTCKNQMDFINNQPEAFNGSGLEAKELCTRYTLDNVAICAFGLQGECFEESDPQFRKIAHRFISPGGVSSMKLFAVTLFPILFKFMKIKIIPQEVEDQLCNIVKDTLKYREENNIVRIDFLHIMNQLRITSDFTELDVIAHAAGFFGDGFETSSLVLSFFLHQLASNPEAQEKLRQEINENFANNGGNLPYEDLQGMQYMDAALNESLRIIPPLFSLGKICTEDYTYIPKPGDGISKSITIEKDTVIILPVYGLHKDPKYYDNPEQYLPERFLGENKENLTKFTFLPFGEGPRACLGQRFGTMQVKASVAYILKNFQLSVNQKTKLPLKFDPTYLMTSAVGGLWIDFKKIH